MLATRGLGRNASDDALLATFGFGRFVSEVSGKFLRRWRSSIRRKRDIADLPITDRKELLRRVQAAIDSLASDRDEALAKRAQRAKKGLLGADSVKRRSLLRLNVEVLIEQLDVVSWALDAWDDQRFRRLREDDDFVVLMLAARQRGWI